MPVTREDSIAVADAFVRERQWTDCWSHKRLSVREAQHERSGRDCWLVWCHSGGVLPPRETQVWVVVAEGTVRRATRVMGRALPEIYEAG